MYREEVKFFMDVENPYYNQNHTREEIESILGIIKTCIVEGKYSISMNSKRQDNIDFRDEYNITSSRAERILLQITTDDFCHTLQNNHKGYEHEILYVFAPHVEVYNILGHKEALCIYVKFNIIPQDDDVITVVISFHKLNKAIEYAFRND